MKTKFQFGDLVIGNAEASQHYSVTRRGTEWIVIDVRVERTKNMIRIANVEHFKNNLPAILHNRDPFNYDMEHYDVIEGCFDFVRPTLSNKEYVNVLEKFDD
jgi:hypothetical protein